MRASQLTNNLVKYYQESIKQLKDDMSKISNSPTKLSQGKKSPTKDQKVVNFIGEESSESQSSMENHNIFEKSDVPVKEIEIQYKDCKP